MASCEATSLVTKLWMKRAFNARNSSMMSADCRSRTAGCISISWALLKCQLARLPGGRVVRRKEAFDLDLLQCRIRRHRQRREGGKEGEAIVALRELHRHDRRGRLRMAWKPPFGRQAGIGHDLIEQLRRRPAALR